MAVASTSTPDWTHAMPRSPSLLLSLFAVASLSACIAAPNGEEDAVVSASDELVSTTARIDIGGVSAGSLVAATVTPTASAHEFSVTFGGGMSPAFHRWIGASLSGEKALQSGTLVTNGEEWTFANARITEIGLPALDASAKSSGYMTLKFSPEYTRYKKASGKVSGEINGLARKSARIPRPSSVRVSVDGSVAKGVKKIDALTWTMKVQEMSTGAARYASAPAARLGITFEDATSAEALTTTARSTDAAKNSGVLVEYVADDGAVIFKARFKHLGIFKLTPDKVESGSEQLRRVKAEMSFDHLQLEQPASTAFLE
jgi:hypothetical protein